MKRYLSLALILSSSLMATTIQLEKGWNLISIPNLTNAVSLNNLKNKLGAKYESMMSFQNNNGILEIQTSKTIKNSGIVPAHGYWLKVNDDVNISFVDGNFKTPILNVGWNLVGFPYKANLDNIKNMIINNKFKYESIMSFRNNNGILEIQTSKTIKQMGIEPTQGYWVKVLKQVDSKQIGNTDKSLIVYVDKPLTDSNKKTVTITVAGQNVNVEVPSDATKAEVRIVDNAGNEIASGIVLNQSDIQNGSYTISSDKVSNLNAITSVAYYVLSANPAGVPQPLSGVNVYDESHNLIGTTDANGIVNIQVGNVDGNSTLTFEKDGYALNTAAFNTNQATNYVFLTPAESVNADELEDNTDNSNNRVLNRVNNKYYAIKTLANKTLGILKIDGFSVNPMLPNLKFTFSSIDGNSFYGKDKLNPMIASWENNGTQYKSQIIGGVQSIIKSNGQILKGSATDFSSIDRTGDATVTYYIPNLLVDQNNLFTQIKQGNAQVKYYAFDGEKWEEVTNANGYDFNITLESNLSSSIAKKKLKKIGYSNNDAVLKISSTKGVKTIVAVLWNKVNTLKTFENVEVKVTENDGTPIKGALVSTLNKTALTNENGIATFDTISVPKNVVNLSFTVTEPHHYRALAQVNIQDMSDNKEVDIEMNRPASTGTIDITTLDDENYPVAKALVDIITPAVLSDVSYEDGVIKVGKESTATYHWYIEPVKNDINSPRRNFRTLTRTLHKLKAGWTEVASGVGQNSITVGDLLKTIIQNADPAVGAVKLGVWVEHKNGLNDGSENNPISIGQANIMFNKNLLSTFGIEKLDESPDTTANPDNIDMSFAGVLGSATASTPYIAVGVPSNMQQDSLNIKWHVLLVYEKDSDNQYYWNGQKWVKSDDLAAATVGDDYISTVYDISKNLNMEINTTDNYLTFDELGNYLTTEDVIKGLFIKKSDVDSDSDTQNLISSPSEDSVLKGNIRLAVIPEVSFKVNNSDKTTTYVSAAEAELENLNVGNVLNIDDLALKPAGVLPHNIYSQTDTDGALRVANVPLKFGDDGTGHSYLNVMAKKAGYLDSDTKNIPGFSEDDPTTSALEDVSNVTLTLDKMKRGDLEVIVKDKDGNVVEGAKLLIPNATVIDNKMGNVLVVDNNTSNDLNESAGAIRVNNVFAKGYSITVLKDGYKALTLPIAVKQNKLNTITAQLEPLASGIVLTEPYVNDLSFVQQNDALSVSGQIEDTQDNNYSNSAKAILILNDKTIAINPDNQGNFNITVKLDKGVNKAKLIVSNAKGTFETSTKTYFYVGETAYFHGYVLDGDNKGLSNAIVEIDTDDGNTIYGTTDSNGKYEVNDMPVGSGVVTAVWVDSDGFVYSSNKDYKINDNIKDYELNLTINATHLAVEAPAKIYTDRYNGASALPAEVSTDTLNIIGRVENFDKENGTIVFDVEHEDGTTDEVTVNAEDILLLNKNSHTYSYKVKLPLKAGQNIIKGSASNPVYGGETIALVVNKSQTETNSTKAVVDMLFTTPSGLAVYPNVTVTTLKGDPVGVYNVANDYNTSYSLLETKLEKGKYYIFDMTAPGYEEDKEVKYIADNSNLYFVLKPVTDTSLPSVTNTPPVVTVSYDNSYQNYYEFSAYAYDPDGDELSYQWFIDGNKNENCSDMSYCEVQLPNGNHTIKVIVSDGADSNSSSVNVDVNYTANKPTIEVPGNIPDGIVGENYSLDISANSNNGSDVTFGADNLPDGLSIDPYSGEISGIPQIAGDYEVTIYADNGEAKASANFVIHIAGASSATENNESLETPPTPPTVDNGEGNNNGLETPPSVPDVK